MLTNDELKKKIISALQSVEFVTEKGWCGQCISLRLDYSAIADALIAAGIGDVKDLQVQVDSLKITNIALQAGYDDAEKDRLYWVDKYKEAEHRAEVAEDVIDEFVESVGIQRRIFGLYKNSRTTRRRNAAGGGEMKGYKRLTHKDDIYYVDVINDKHEIVCSPKSDNNLCVVLSAQKIVKLLNRLVELENIVDN